MGLHAELNAKRERKREKNAIGITKAKMAVAQRLLAYTKQDSDIPEQMDLSGGTADNPVNPHKCPLGYLFSIVFDQGIRSGRAAEAPKVLE